MSSLSQRFDTNTQIPKSMYKSEYIQFNEISRYVYVCVCVCVWMKREGERERYIQIYRYTIRNTHRCSGEKIKCVGWLVLFAACQLLWLYEGVLPACRGEAVGVFYPHPERKAKFWQINFNVYFRKLLWTQKYENDSNLQKEKRRVFIAKNISV